MELQVSRMKQSARKQYVSPMLFAYVYARLGLREETIHFLEEAYKEPSPRLVLIQLSQTLTSFTPMNAIGQL